MHDSNPYAAPAAYSDNGDRRGMLGAHSVFYLVCKPSILLHTADGLSPLAAFVIGAIAWPATLAVLCGVAFGCACEPYRDIWQFWETCIETGALFGAPLGFGCSLVVGGLLYFPFSRRFGALACLWPVTSFMPIMCWSVCFGLYMVSDDTVEVLNKPSSLSTPWLCAPTVGLGVTVLLVNCIAVLGVITRRDRKVTL